MSIPANGSDYAKLASGTFGSFWIVARAFPFVFPDMISFAGGTFSIATAATIGSNLPDTIEKTIKCGTAIFSCTVISGGISLLPIGIFAKDALCLVSDITAFLWINGIKYPLPYNPVPQEE